MKVTLKSKSISTYMADILCTGESLVKPIVNEHGLPSKVTFRLNLTLAMVKIKATLKPLTCRHHEKRLKKIAPKDLFFNLNLLQKSTFLDLLNRQVVFCLFSFLFWGQWQSWVTTVVEGGDVG